MAEFLYPLFFVLLGVVALVVYVLAVALRETTRKLAKMNELLLIYASIKKVGPEAGRALVAAGRKPKKEIPGVAKEPEKEERPKGYTVTVGAR